MMTDSNITIMVSSPAWNPGKPSPLNFLRVEVKKVDRCTLRVMVETVDRCTTCTIFLHL